MDRDHEAVERRVARRTLGSGLARGGGTVQDRLRDVYLHPGQSYVATSPVTLKMILGSCAGVFLFDPFLAIGGATHFMLPRHGTGLPSPRYGDVAIAGLLERLRALGSKDTNIEAKVFGGASMLSALRDLQSAHIGLIGRRNVEAALQILAQERIAITDKSVLGDRGRKVSMVSDTGEITLELVSNADGNR